MTSGGQNARGSSGWVNPALVDGFAAGQGLELRSSEFNSANGEAIEGILPSIYFGFDQAAIRPSDRPALQEAADYLRQHPGARLIVEGHCDWRGTSEYNLALGERRASSARDYLITLGISQDRIEVVSMGDLEASQASDEARLGQDRRADLLVIP